MIYCPSCHARLPDELDELDEIFEGEEIECEQCTALLEIVSMEPLKVKLVG